MVQHADSLRMRRQKAAQAAEQHMLQTLASYCTELLCAQQEDQKPVTAQEHASNCGVPYTTFLRRLKGRKSHSAAAMAWSWLNQAENDTLVDFLLLMSDHGFPLTHNGAAEYALELAQIQHPNLQALGINWVDSFLIHNKDQLNSKWSANLENIHGGAVNPTTIEHWFQLLHAQYKEFNFLPENIYAMDESSFPFGTGEKVKVIAWKMTK
jgi:hypothetical protein